MRVFALGMTLTIAFPALSAGQGMDRVNLVAAEVRRCENLLLSSPQMTLGLQLFGLSAKRLCQCEAPITISTLSADEVALAYRTGRFPKNFNQIVAEVMKYCVAMQPFPGVTR